MRSKYTRSDKKTSFVVGQYLRMRNRYASRVMVGMLRAWKVRAEAGLASAVRDADLRERHMEEREGESDEGVWEWFGRVCAGASAEERASLVRAICVSNEARSLRRSVGA